MKTKQWIVWLLAAAALVALIAYVRAKIPFNWAVFGEQIRLADWRRIALGIAFIYLGYVLRAFRWALLVRPVKRVSAWSLLGSQVIGFTAVALLGRLADLVRPYLVARRVHLPLGSQIAVYTVERMFDAGAMALIFSTVLLLDPHRASLPHHELLARVAIGGLAGTAALATFALVARLSGEIAARFAGRMFSLVSPALGQSVSSKILAFRNGLNTIGSFGSFAAATAISLAMWGLITQAYLQTTRAFTASPELASMTLPKCLVLMAASMGGSIVQLPIIGWFTTIFATSATMKALFSVAPEPALGCGAMLLIVTFMCIVPIGLVWAQVEHVSLKRVTEESEHAGETPEALAEEV